MHFHNKFKDYLHICSYGLIAGVLARLTDFLPTSNLWYIQSISTLHGFWIICMAVLIWRSVSHLTAGINVLLFCLFATTAYFGSAYLLALIHSNFQYGDFQTKTFLNYVMISVACGIAAFVLYAWSHGNWYSAVVLAIPIGLLTAETITVLMMLNKNQTHLFQVLLNAGFCLYLGLQFRKLTKFKELYTVSVIAITGLLYHFLF